MGLDTSHYISRLVAYHNDGCVVVIACRDVYRYQ